MTVTFIKTSDFNGINFNPSTGLLTPGTYTVTFRSAANGFEDMSGGLLEGNTGVAGDNYTATFVVAAFPVAIGVPAFARGPGNTVVLPAATGTGIPVNISSGSGVTAGTFTLQYNSAFLTITGATVNSALPAGASFVLEPASTPGSAVLMFSSPTALSAGVQRLGALQAAVPDAAAASYTAKALLHFAGLQINGGAIAVVSDDAVEVVAYDGDAAGTGVLNGFDATLISRLPRHGHRQWRCGRFSRVPLGRSRHHRRFIGRRHHQRRRPHTAQLRPGRHSQAAGAAIQSRWIDDHTYRRRSNH